MNITLNHKDEIKIRNPNTSQNECKVVHLSMILLGEKIKYF